MKKHSKKRMAEIKQNIDDLKKKHPNLKMVALEDLPKWAKDKLPETEFTCMLCGETHKGMDHKCQPKPTKSET